MWQMEIDGKRKVFETKEEVLLFLYDTSWSSAKAMCMECGEFLETEEEVDVFSFVDKHDGHFGALMELESHDLFESLEAVGGEEV